VAVVVVVAVDMAWPSGIIGRWRVDEARAEGSSSSRSTDEPRLVITMAWWGRPAHERERERERERGEGRFILNINK